MTLDTPLVAAVLYAITTVNSLTGTGVMTALFTIYLLRRGERRWAEVAVAAVAGTMVINALVKLLVARARPGLDDAWEVLTTYSFPSGHTSAAAAFYGVLAVYACSRNHEMRTRAAIVAGAVLAVALVATSRVYLGVHYMSDVLAAAALGVAWAAICIRAGQPPMQYPPPSAARG